MVGRDYRRSVAAQVAPDYCAEHHQVYAGHRADLVLHIGNHYSEV